MKKKIAVLSGVNRLDAINTMELIANKLKNKGVPYVSVNYRFLRVDTAHTTTTLFMHGGADDSLLSYFDKLFGFLNRPKDYSNEVVDYILSIEKNTPKEDVSK